VILFLDFDGVLHPEGEAHIHDGGADFCFLPRLEALLREFPEVKIVISSAWREQVRYETLVKPFLQRYPGANSGSHASFRLRPTAALQEAGRRNPRLAPTPRRHRRSLGGA
jgi:hypothetical protein